eukprot:3708746-Rhodomonas_salina.4
MKLSCGSLKLREGARFVSALPRNGRRKVVFLSLCPTSRVASWLGSAICALLSISAVDPPERIPLAPERRE